MFEDDAILVDNFKEQLTIYLNELETIEWDIVFSGECCGLHANKTTSKILYKSTTTRGTCMYILNKGVCKKINDIFNIEPKINKSIDHWFNDMQPKYNLQYYWSEPTVVSQGSETKIFKSAIRNCN